MKAVRSITSQDDLDEFENQWRSALAGRSLVIEANAQPSVADEALRVLGSNYRRQAGPELRKKLLFRYRASLLVGVCTTATKYDVGGMWPYLSDAFGELGPTDQKVISEVFRSALDQFRLSRFDFPRRNVDEILMHAGIPGQRMDEFIELLAARDAKRNGLNGAQFCGWLSSIPMSTATNQHHLDAPTYRFLTHGREIAEDFVDRCLELLDAWRVDPSSVDVASFPAIMQPDLLRALDELGQKPAPRRSGARERRLSLNPVLTFSPSRGVTVQLPSLEILADARVDWLIAYEGTVQRRSLEPPWPGDPIKVEHVPVSRAAKDISLRADPGTNEWSLLLVDPDDPLLLFDGETGALIPARNSLPQTDVWVAVPNQDGVPLGQLLEFEGRAPDIQMIEAPLGWGLWSFASVALSGVSRLRMIGHSQWRAVSTLSRPSIDGVDQVRSARGLDGAPVWAAPPRVTLPAVDASIATDALVPWTVVATNLATEAEVFRQAVEVGGSALTIDLADGTLSTAVGSFEVSVKGPLGRGIVRRFHIATGLKVAPDVEFRLMSAFGDGLIATGFTLSAPPHIEVAPRIELGPRDDIAPVSIQSKTGLLDAVLTVPSMSVNLQKGMSVPVKSYSPIQVDVEELVETELRIVVGQAGPCQLAAFHAGELIQTVRANSIGDAGVVRFPLSQLADTLAASGGGQLLMGIEGVRIPVAHVRPRELATAITVEHGIVFIHGRATAETLELAAYPRFAPWVDPILLTTEGDTVPLPSNLAGEGRARFLVRIADPWVSLPWPDEAPHRGVNVFDVDLGELQDDGVDDMPGFRTWLNRSGPCPSVSGDVPRAIWLYAGPHLEKYSTPADELRRELAQQIAHVKDRVPAEYTEARVEAAPVDLFIAAEVAMLPPATYEHVSVLWDSSPLLAALARDWGAGDNDEKALRVLGDTVLTILENGEDEFSTIGRFSGTAEVMARWPDDRIESVWKSANAIPKRLLDQDTRMIAAKQLFDARNGLGFDPRAVVQLLPQTERVLTRDVNEQASDVLAARRGTHGWTATPEMTLAFGLLARAAARGYERPAALYAHLKPTHEALARVAPLMVEQDLILAELWMTRWRMT